MKSTHRTRRRRWARGLPCGLWLVASVFAEVWDPPAVRVFPDHDEVASKPALLPEFVRQGKELFEAKFNELDGAGRPGATGDSKPTPRSPEHDVGLTRSAGPDAMSCASCHNQPAVGGSGDFVANAFVGAHFTDPPTNRIDTEVTNERNTTSVFGAGWIEILAREMTEELKALRDEALQEAATLSRDVRKRLSAKGVDFGAIVARPDGTVSADQLVGVDYDLVVRPFGVKGVAASLREFTIAALNQHHGIQAIERFGWEKTGRRDFDLDGVENEFSVGQLSALVVFQAQLPAPPQTFSKDPGLRKIEREGQKLFGQIGCATCHIPAIKVKRSVFQEPNPFNRPGAITPDDIEGTVEIDLGKEFITVRAYTDLKRHNLCDDEVNHFCNENHKQDNVDTGLFLTAKLWDLAVSAPYGHRGDLRTISGAILAHGGEAREQRLRFERLKDSEKKALIAFLLTLGRPAGASSTP